MEKHKASSSMLNTNPEMVHAPKGLVLPNVTIFNAHTPLQKDDGYIDISDYIPTGKQLVTATVLVNIGGEKWVTLPYTDAHTDAAYFSKHYIDLKTKQIVFHNLGIRLLRRPCRVKIEWID